MSTFTFNNILSSDIGLMVTKTPIPPCSIESVETIYIPGGEGITTSNEYRENVSIPIEAAIINPDMLRTIYSTYQGAGPLILSNEPDIFYKVIRCGAITPDNIARYLQKVAFEFECEPYAYSLDNDAIELTGTDTEQTITVGGGYFCRPTYKIYGSGDIALIVNDDTEKPLRIFDVDGYVIVDTSLMVVHKDKVLQGNSGRLPFLDVGENIIQTQGNVAAVEITKNERWI